MREQSGRSEPDEKRIKSKKQEDEEKQRYYENIFNDADREDFDLAAGVDGIDDEIALLRQEIKKILNGESDPAILRSIIQAVNALERLLRTKYHISKDQKKSLLEQAGDILQKAALSLGVTAATEMVKKQLGG